MRSHFQTNLIKIGGLALIAVLLCAIFFIVRRESLPREDRSNKGQMTEGAAPTVDRFESAQKIQLPQVITALDGGNARMIDARPSLFYQMGHLPGALNLPKESFQAAYVQSPDLALDKQRLLIVYCESANCTDSTMVANDLQAVGHVNVAVYSAGWQEWQASGQRIETGR